MTSKPASSTLSTTTCATFAPAPSRIELLEVLGESECTDTSEHREGLVALLSTVVIARSARSPRYGWKA